MNWIERVVPAASGSEYIEELVRRYRPSLMWSDHRRASPRPQRRLQSRAANAAFPRGHRGRTSAGTRPRPVPYIFSTDEIQRILQAASELGKRNTFRGHTYKTFFALLACTGLRVSEAIHLCFQDITTDGLVIRCSKFRKSRLVPLHETTQAGLEQYLLRRRAYTPLDDHVFVSLRRRPSPTSVRNSASARMPPARKPSGRLRNCAIG